MSMTNTRPIVALDFEAGAVGANVSGRIYADSNIEQYTVFLRSDGNGTLSILKPDIGNESAGPGVSCRNIDFDASQGPQFYTFAFDINGWFQVQFAPDTTAQYRAEVNSRERK